MDNNVGIDIVLDLFLIIDYSDVCEVFLFIDCDFEGGILGFVWIGDFDGGVVGGICDKFVDYGGGKKWSYNIGVVILKFYGWFIFLRVLEIMFVYEFGYGFGF